MKTDSRRDVFREKCELLNFERYCRMFGVDDQVTEAFYDSKACLCSIEVKPGADIAAIRQAAALALSQYDIDGWIGLKSSNARHVFDQCDLTF